MFNPYSSFFGFNLPTYTLYISLGLLLALGIMLVINRHNASIRQITDLFLGGLIGGLIFARAGYMLLHFDYFSLLLNESLRFSAGGLDWHGAMVGGMSGLWLMSHLRNVPLNRILDSVVLALPLLMLAAWHGCEAAACAYGAEITRMAAYPSWLVWEANDIYGLNAPRYATQPTGMMVAAGLFIVCLILYWRNWFPERRFWIMLTAISLSMFITGFMRGDSIPMIASIRLDQWLDLLFAALGVIQMIRTHPLHTKKEYHTTHTEVVSES